MNALVAAAVGFGRVKVSLINGKALFLTVIGKVLELVAAVAAGAVALVQTFVVGHLPMGIAQIEERRAVGIAEEVAVLFCCNVAVLFKVGFRLCAYADYRAAVGKGNVILIGTGNGILPLSCFVG